jgi:hypothetical protein
MSNEKWEAHKKLAERVRDSLESRLESNPSSIFLNGNGHSLNERSIGHLSLLNFIVFPEDDLIKIERGEKVEPQPFSFGGGQCWYCGDYYTSTFDGVTITADSKCKFPVEFRSILLN